MIQKFKKYGAVIFAVMAIVFLVATYVANGSEKETAWLYIFSIWLVIYAAYIALPKKKDKTR